SPTARITVTGTGTVTGTPNQLVLSMGVQVTGGSVSSALAAANQATSRVTAALKSQGVASADIQTSGLSIYPSYSGQSQVPTGYQVTESLTATLKELSRAGQQIQAAANAGGNAITVSNVSLNLTDDGPLLAIARANAMKDARAKAAQFARAASEQLGQIISITPVTSSIPPVPGAQRSAAASGAVPISPGTQQVSVTVTVVYAV
ncbi:MAG: SIMPL domain-containing protein, partial [Actinobacteria bacterium]|nr:SIMPL domain-containing protein [Actinomycetota bacterium]